MHESDHEPNTDESQIGQYDGLPNPGFIQDVDVNDYAPNRNK